MSNSVRCHLAVVCLAGVMPFALTGCNQAETSGTSSSAPNRGTVDQAPAKSEALDPRDDSTELASSEIPAQRREDAVAPAEPAESTPIPTPRAARPEAVPLEELADDDLTMPRMTMTEAHANSCLVKVGEPFPPLTLPDLGGGTKPLAGLLGDKLTVILFWNGSKPTALEELAELQREVASRYAGNGVSVVAINSGDPAPAASELVKQAGVSFPILHDAESTALKQIATGDVPRTFLVDHSGKVVWLDLEYSWTTRRDLSQAIRYLLTH